MQENKIYDVTIVGTGPAGIFTALELSKLAPELKILMLEKGPLRLTRDPKTLTSGFGGAGMFTDGKLTLHFGAGGDLPGILTPQKLEELVSYVDETYLNFLGSGSNEVVFGGNKNSKKIKELQKKAQAVGFRLIPGKTRHFGSDRTPQIVENIRKYLLAKNIEISLKTRVESVDLEGGVFRLKVIKDDREEIIVAKKVVLAPGRDGAEWLKQEACKLGINLKNPSQRVDIGARVEVPYSVLEELTDALYDFKLYYISDTYKDQVRSFCVCPGGEVELEYSVEIGVITVNGHSVYDPARKTQNTNFALLVSINLTDPFKDSLTFGKLHCQKANLIAGTVVVQLLGDLKSGHRSWPHHLERSHVKPTCKEAVPGDLGFILGYRFMLDILETIRAMDKIAPGIDSPHTLLYGPEVKFYTNRIDLDENFGTPVSGLYVAGDASGISRGIMQASIMGVVAARDIVSKMQK